MPSGFENHKIGHSSPSSINMWCDAPCAWVARYLFDRKFSFSLAAKAGVLAEEAVVNIIGRGMTQDAAVENAIGEYNKASAFGASDADRKRGESIAGMIDLAVTELKQYGTPEFAPDGRQKKIEIMCNGDGWQLPVIGYLDFHFPLHGLIVDLKTTMRMPSEMSSSHLRQQALYQKAMGNNAVKFLYVTGKKSQIFECGDVGNILGEIKDILNRQERFLAVGNRDVIKGIVPVNQSSFYWSGDESIRKELYSI